MKKLLLSLTAIAALFAGCSSDDDFTTGTATSPAGKTVSLTINASMAPSTRISYTEADGGTRATFREGDYLMVYWKDAANKWTNGHMDIDPSTIGQSTARFVGDVTVPADLTGVQVHVLMSNDHGGANCKETANGGTLVLDLRQQDGTLEDAALHTEYEQPLIDITDDMLTWNDDHTTATLSGITLEPMTSVIKLTMTFPEGTPLTTQTPLSVTTNDTYTMVHITSGVPGASSLPNKAGTGEATFQITPGEVNGNVATAYLSVWPTGAEGSLKSLDVNSTIGVFTYNGYYKTEKETAPVAGKLYRAAIEMCQIGTQDQEVWVTDAAQQIDAIQGTLSSFDEQADWLSYADGKISVAANTTGSPRTGKIKVSLDGTNVVTYKVSQMDVDDFKGEYSFTTKTFHGTDGFRPAKDPDVFDVTIGAPRKGYTLTDADGKTHTNNLGITGLFYTAVADAAMEIDYEARTAKMGIFFDARDGEGQEVTIGGATKYATFVPGLATTVPPNVPYGNWAKDWKYDETELGDPDYAWIWFVVQPDDLGKVMYKNRYNGNGHELDKLTQYTVKSTYTGDSSKKNATKGQTMNSIVGVDGVLSATNVFNHSTVNGYATVYQVNPTIDDINGNQPGMWFERK